MLALAIAKVMAANPCVIMLLNKIVLQAVSGLGILKWGLATAMVNLKRQAHAFL
jgi:hypothetical protein